MASPKTGHSAAMSMMRKMGWRQGEGLGKLNQGDVALVATRVLASARKGAERAGIGTTAVSAEPVAASVPFMSGQKRSRSYSMDIDYHVSHLSDSDDSDSSDHEFGMVDDNPFLPLHSPTAFAQHAHAATPQVKRKRPRSGKVHRKRNTAHDSALRARPSLAVGDDVRHTGTLRSDAGGVEHGMLALATCSSGQGNAHELAVHAGDDAVAVSNGEGCFASGTSEEDSAVPTDSRVSIAARRHKASLRRRQQRHARVLEMTDCPSGLVGLCPSLPLSAAGDRGGASDACPLGMRHGATALSAGYCEAWVQHVGHIDTNVLPCPQGTTCPQLHPPDSFLHATDCAQFLRGKCKLRHCPLRHSPQVLQDTLCGRLELCPEWEGLWFRHAPTPAQGACTNRTDTGANDSVGVGGCPHGPNCSLMHVPNPRHLVSASPYIDLLLKRGSRSTAAYAQGLVSAMMASSVAYGRHLRADTPRKVVAAIPPPSHLHLPFGMQTSTNVTTGASGNTPTLAPPGGDTPGMAQLRRHINAEEYVPVAMRAPSLHACDQEFEFTPQEQGAGTAQRVVRYGTRVDGEPRCGTVGVLGSCEASGQFVLPTAPFVSVLRQFGPVSDRTGQVSLILTNGCVVRNGCVMCSHFDVLTGQGCPLGESCPLPHPLKCVANKPALGGGYCGSDTCPFYHHVATIACRAWQRAGKCHWGDCCNFRHHEAGNPLTTGSHLSDDE